MTDDALGRTLRGMWGRVAAAEETQFTIYIAGPMTGIADFNYPAFRAAGGKLQEVGYATLNPADIEDFNPTPGQPQAWDWHMRHALRMVADARGIALLDGWEKSRGATLERHVGVALGLDVRPFAEWFTS